MQLRRILIVLSILLGLGSAPSGGGSGQPGTTGSTAPADTSGVSGVLSDVLKQAGKAGATVIVVDGSGKATTTAAPDTAPSLAENSILPPKMSPMMSFQHSVMNFRLTLHNRLSALPNSLHLVATTLRAASPDGSIGTFGSALLLVLGCFAIGYLVEWQIPMAGASPGISSCR